MAGMQVVSVLGLTGGAGARAGFGEVGLAVAFLLLLDASLLDTPAHKLPLSYARCARFTACLDSSSAGRCHASM